MNKRTGTRRFIYNSRMSENTEQDNVDERADAKQQRLYNSLNQSLITSQFGGSAAEAHGIASALCCRGVGINQLDPILDKFNLTDQVALVSVQSLMEMSKRNLGQTNFSFELWLPQEVGLIFESSALSQWCSGFIIAFLHDGEGIMDKLGETAAEAIDDIVQIAAIEHTADSEEDQALADNEVAFFEITEYVRMSVQLIFEELNPTQETEAPNQ
ncbi:MAG: hypothetical protein ACI9J2_000616 [Saprospiraceae bacterium]|jgi:uncharacterized protein YgfB (UPF0149 family)